VSYPHRTRSAAQRAALFFFVAGLLAIVNSLLLEAARSQQTAFIALGALDLVIAALLYVLPWERWHVRALLLLIPVTFVVIGLFQLAGATTAATYPIFFILVFIWVGLSLPPRTALLLAPLTVVGYVLPLLGSGHGADIVESATVAVPICILIGEVIARVVSQLHGAQDELEQRVAKRTAQLQAANAALERELAERRQVEMALRESDLRFRQLAEHIHEVFWLVDPHTPRLLYISPAYEAIWDRSCASLYEQPLSFLDAVHAADRERVIESLGRQKGGEATDEEYRIILSDGVVRWIWDRGFPVADAAGQVERIARVTQDITDRKQLESQLRQSQKLEGLGRLAGGISHDFNNLLTAIGGYADLIGLTLPRDHPTRSHLAQIQKCVVRASNFTKQLLVFARKQIIEPRALNLNELIVEMNKLLHPIIGSNIELITRLAPSLGWVKADVGQIEQVLMNLVVNARDAMPVGGKLTVETSNVVLDRSYTQGHRRVTEGPYVLLAVSDTGVGMDAEVQAHAFEPFFTTKALGKGTGLGLATCYGIVEQHGGHIWVYSEVGQGTTFKIYLPQVAEPAIAASPPAEQQALPRGTETLLVVEDEADVRALVTQALRGQGYRVLEAVDGADAIRVAESYAPAAIDLLVTDVVMLHMGGKEAAAAIVAHYPTIKVLFMSGYTDGAIVHNGQLDEGVAFLHKPFTLAALIRKVREVLDSTR
jgi:PAS domain S-box-containing protein